MGLLGLEPRLCHSYMPYLRPLHSTPAPFPSFYLKQSLSWYIFVGWVVFKNILTDCSGIPDSLAQCCVCLTFPWPWQAPGDTLRQPTMRQLNLHRIGQGLEIWKGLSWQSENVFFSRLLNVWLTFGSKVGSKLKYPFPSHPKLEGSPSDLLWYSFCQSAVITLSCSFKGFCCECFASPDVS